MRKTKRPVFGIIGDIYKIEYLIPISILVSGCGGSIPLNSITINEAVNFGIPFQSGPYVMQLNQKILNFFNLVILGHKDLIKSYLGVVL
jgi:hypothetical protein